MTREFSTKPRFEDNGDIEPCDTESRMINRPDDFGVRESSSSGRASDSANTAAISVPLLQSPTTTQGPGDAACDEDFVTPPHPAMVAAGATMGRVETNAGLALGTGYLDNRSMQRTMATSPMLKERRSLRDRTPRFQVASQANVSASSPPPTTSTTTATSQISQTTFATVTNVEVGNTAVQQSAAAEKNAFEKRIINNQDCESNGFEFVSESSFRRCGGNPVRNDEADEAAVLVEIKSAVSHQGNDCHVTTNDEKENEDHSNQVGAQASVSASDNNKKANYDLNKNGILEIEFELANSANDNAEKKMVIGSAVEQELGSKPGVGLGPEDSLAEIAEQHDLMKTCNPKKTMKKQVSSKALFAKGHSSSSSLLVSVINSSSSADYYSFSNNSQTSDDSLHKMKLNLKTISDDDNMIPTIKPSDYYYNDNNVNKQFILQNRAQSPSIADKNTTSDEHVELAPKTQFEVDATPVAAGDVALSKLQEQPNTFVVKDPSPKNNAISSINRSSNGCGPCDSGAPKPSQVATKNDIPNELVSFKDDDAQKIDYFMSKKAHVTMGFISDRFVPKNNKAATVVKPCSLSSPFVSCASQFSSYSRRSGWNVPMIGLKGGMAGGETSVANGTSGWGPPPTGAASTSGWGAPPPPNPTASAAWGAPASAPPVGFGSKSPQQEDGSNNAMTMAPIVKAPLTVAPPPALPPAPIVSQPIVASSAPIAPAASAIITGGPPVQPLQTSTSWAAAAGKGLPTTTNDQTNTTSSVTASNGSTSKHLEQLNSVREALFSQDGWGGSNVKQDSAWNVDGITPSSNVSASASGASASSASAAGASSASAATASATSAPVEPKESNTWGAGGSGHKNDGTDLWRVTLSGQPPVSVAKPQPNNAWNHTPQNNTDFKQWGVNDDDDHHGPSQQGQGANGAIGGQRSHHGQGGQGNESSNPLWGGAGNDGPSNNGPNQFKPRHNDWNQGSAGGGSWGNNDRNNDRNDPMVGGGRGGPGNGGMNMNDPVGNVGGGWGPSPAKPTPGQWGGNNNPTGRGGPSNSWDLESPNMQRRGGDGMGRGGPPRDAVQVGQGGNGGGSTDDGTSHWGFKPPPQPSAAPGPAGVSHWKDMPSSNSQMRGPPAGPAPQPRFGGPPAKDSIWPRGANAWGDMSDNSQMGGGGSGGGGIGGGWGDIDGGNKRESSAWPDSGPTGGSGGGWGGNRGRNPVGPSNGGMHRSSPGWGNQDDSSGLDGGWPNSSMKAVGGGPKKPTEMMWQQSKQYSMLLDMGYRKDEVEQALHTVNGNLEDALEMLGSNRGMPPSRGRGGNVDGPMGFGGVGRNDNMYGNESRRFPGPGQGMGPPYGGPQDPSLVNNPGLQGSFSSGPGNPMMQKMGMPSSGASGMNPNSNSALPAPGSLGAMPPISNTRQPQQPQQQQQPSSQPSAQQLRMLVQQIQMAVQAGHLNPQILNQPLAPQTLILLNQLLQQIKTLQTLQQSHSVAQSQKPMNNSRELLSISVNITKTKQHITNLQNQISAQQATYLKSQNMGGQGGGNSAGSGGSSGAPGSAGMPPGHLGGSSNEPSMPDLFNELSLSSGNSGMNDNVGGSRLSQWKLTPGDSLFGGSSGNASKSVVGGKNASSPGLGFGGDDTWGLPSNSTSSGWPEKSGGPGNGAPGGPSVSVAPGAPGLNNNSGSSGIGGVSSNNVTNNDALNGIDAFGIPEFEPGKPWKGPGLKNPDEDPTLTPGSVAPSALDLMSSKTNNSLTSSSNSTLVENTLGLTSPTWSFNNPTSSEKPKDSWGMSTNPTSTLTAMGQDLWGKSGRSNPPGLSNSGSSWPATTSSGSSNGWSSGQNGSASINSNSGFDQPTWLLLKNLTPQIDGSTLKTLCIQHGPLKNFHLFLNNGIALVMYASGREATKAQKALNNCLLGNTTIQATMTTENEASQIMQTLAGGGSGQSQNQTGSRGNTPSSVANTFAPTIPKSSSSSGNDMWGNSMVSTSIYSGSSIWGAPTSDEATRNTPQLQPYLPGDLLGESNM